MQKQKFFYAVFVTFLALGLGLSYPGDAIGANCYSGFFPNPTDWGSVPWTCSHIPNSGDDASVGGPDPPITVTLDQDIVIQRLMLFPNATLNANSHTITLSSATPIQIDGTFNAGTSTIKFSDADHTVNSSFTLYNWQWETPLTAPRILTINAGTTVSKAAGGTFTLDGTAANPVSFAGTGTISPALTVYYCNSSTVTGVDCQAGGPFPSVTSVTSSTANGAYRAGTVIPVTVTFSEAVNVIGTPQLKLETGTTDAVVDYFSGTGTATLTFDYTVSAGHTSADLDYVATDSLVLNSGTIKNGSGDDAVLTLPTPGATNSLGDSKAIVIDTTAPTVAISSAALDPTNSSPFSVTITFNEDVTGFAVGDISVTNGTAGNFANTTPNQVWTADITPSSDGAVDVDVNANVAQDDAGNDNTAATQLSRTYDGTAPTVTINKAAAQADPANSTPVNFTVVFSESLTTFATGDVTLSGTATGTLTGTVTGSGTTYNVAVSGMTSAGTVIANIAAGVASDSAGNGNTAGTFTDNEVDFTPPPPSVSSINRTGTTPTNAVSVQFTVTFSESVSGIDIGDFVLAKTGTADGTIATVSAAAGTSVTVTVNTVSGGGTLGLNLTDDDTVVNGMSVPLGGTGAGNGDFTGQVYTIDNTGPAVLNVTSAAADGTYYIGDVIVVTVQFHETVTVTGTPTLTLETGVSDVTIDYGGGSGSDTLTFSYTVMPGNASADLDYPNNTALALNGGTIRDATSNDAALTLAVPGTANSLGGNKALIIDGSVRLVINETDYDQGASDDAEFIEIKNISAAAVNLSGYAVKLIDNTAGPGVYQTINLDNVSLAAGDYHVICDTVGTTVADCDQAAALGNDFIQNGSPDAVALYKGVSLIDTVSYDGDTAGYTEGTGAPADNDTGDIYGISRIPDGADTDDNSADFQQRCVTPGASNSAVAPPATCNTAPFVVATGIPNQTAVENGPAVTLNMRSYFDDAQDGTDLVYTVFANTGAGIVTPAINAATDILTLTPVADAFGTANITIRAADTGGFFADDTFMMTVSEAAAPPAPGPAPAPENPSTGLPDTAYPVYRFYSEGLLKHLFTSDENEKAHLIANASDVWRYEGIAYYSYTNANGALVPVYRFYSEALMTHLFTIDENEKAHLIANASEVWRYEGIAFYVPANYQAGTLPVYRFYSEALKVHLFTIDENEKNHLIETAGDVWRYEGIAYYARPASADAAFRTSAAATFRPGDTTGNVSDAGSVIYAGDAPVILEDAEDGDTAGWTAYNGAVTVFNMPDPDSAENRVIEIPLDCADALFGFILPQPAASSKLSWRMRFDDDYMIYAGCRTSDGNRFLVYTANSVDADYPDVDDYIYIGLGDVTAVGNWITVTRDLQADMAGTGEEATISQIFGFYISGQGFIDDLLLPAE